MRPLKAFASLFFSIALLLGASAAFSQTSETTDSSANNLLLADANSPAVQVDAEHLDKVIQNALSQFHTPGMSVAIVHNNDVIYEKGFGQANIKEQNEVSPSTFFRLASTSKAFTAGALGILVDQEKLQWDDLVIDHLPNFRMKDAYATAQFTVEDLLTHKSGLLSGAGDSMIWPEPSGFSRQEVIENLRFLTPEYDFGREYAYSNVMYITAGELIAKISGQSFGEFVDEHIFGALNIECYAGEMPESAVTKSAMSYGHNDEKGIYEIPRNAIYGEALMSSAAGGIVCSSQGMAKWIKALLRPETLPFSVQQLEKMWQSHTILGVSDAEKEWNGTHFKNYGMGWRIENVGQYKLVSHTGTLSGYQAYVALIPELDMGSVVLNNGSNYGARGAVMQAIVNMFVSTEQKDWVQQYIDYQDEREKAYLARAKTPEASAKMTLELKALEGKYRDEWFGDFMISKQGKQMRIESSRMKTLTGTIEGFQDNIFKIVWDNQNAASDAFLRTLLSLDREVASFKLHPFSVNERNNHEWRDMHFIKVEDE